MYKSIKLSLAMACCWQVISLQLPVYQHSHPIKQPSQDLAVNQLICASCKLPFAKTSEKPLTHCPSFSYYDNKSLPHFLVGFQTPFKRLSDPWNCPQFRISPWGSSIGNTGTLFQPNRSVFDRAINIWVENCSRKRCFMVPNNNTVYQSGPQRSTGGCRKQNVMGLGFVGETGA